MYIDLEPQNNLHPGYELLNRALYYASRLIDRQKGEAFIGSNYDDVRKIYSIWICTNPKPKQKDCINYYTIQEDSIKGNYHTSIDYKKLNIIMLYIGDDYDYNLTGILEMLSLIFKKTGHNPSTVVQKLNNSYDILIKEREVQEVSNLSKGLIENERINNILSMVKHGFPLNDIFEALNVDDDIKQVVLDKLKEEEDRI